MPTLKVQTLRCPSWKALDITNSRTLCKLCTPNLVPNLTGRCKPSLRRTKDWAPLLWTCRTLRYQSTQFRWATSWTKSTVWTRLKTSEARSPTRTCNCSIRHLASQASTSLRCPCHPCPRPMSCPEELSNSITWGATTRSIRAISSNYRWTMTRWSN